MSPTRGELSHGEVRTKAGRTWEDRGTRHLAGVGAEFACVTARNGQRGRPLGAHDHRGGLRDSRRGGRT